MAVRQHAFPLEESGSKYLNLECLLRGNFCLFSITFSLCSVYILLFIKVCMLELLEDVSVTVTY